ncbi:MAG: Ppx/GppA phosphatase family protein [Chloroflexi bacterium]|nr:Ppx/GppA phosphatase family protein [Chloroflexota bacterium]MDA1147369.1 Ppx/GppA phosphatase family protein [Chloroflexota bacterium]
MPSGDLEYPINESHLSQPPIAGRTTVIDLGSNSGRAVVIQPRAGGHLEVVEELRLPLRLGAALGDDGYLSEAAYDRLAAAIEDFLVIAKAAGSEHLVAVGTSALRDAKNGPEFLQRIRDTFGLEVRLVDGALEGHYAFLGAVHGLPVDHGMLVDIGGGSVEIARFRDRRVAELWSFPLGTLRAGGRFLLDDPPTEAQYDALRAATEEALRDSAIPTLRRDERLIGTGGAIRNVAKIDRRRRSRVYPVPRLHGYEIRRSRVAKVGALLRGLRAADRGAVSGLNPGRAETIVAGVTVLETIMSTLKARSLVVSGQGLREGVMRATLGELPPPELESALPDPLTIRAASMRALTGRFAGLDLAAGERRARAALTLLERAGDPVGGNLRELIGYAAVMVDAGAAIDFYNREQVAAGIVITTDLAGFSHLMIAELAALLRLLEEPTFDVHRFAPLLSADERGQLDLAAAALALAFELHRRLPAAAFAMLEATVTKKEIRLSVPSSIGHLPDAVIARVEGAFGRSLAVEVR